MRYRLMATLKSLMRSRWAGGKEYGHLDSRRLHKVATGNLHVYKQKVETAKLDTAVMLMIDHSGSMAGSRLQLAAEAALVMGDVLHQLHVPFSVAGFSTESPVEYPREKGYSRWNRLWICKHVDWNENWPTAAHKLTNLKPKNNTLDGESLRWGAQQLMSRPEKRKVLFWFNDGYPEPGHGDVGTCQKYLKDVVESCRKAGVEVVAFGIQSDAVEEYFPKHVVINKLEDLVREPLNHLDRILREGMK
jgi:cobalamin biosynthesis protein CobT